ncbi:MAG: hypothetical protein WC277_11315 [Bacilli bacterium]
MTASIFAALLAVLLVLASIWCALAILSEIEDLAYWLHKRWWRR